MYVCIYVCMYVCMYVLCVCVVYLLNRGYHSCDQRNATRFRRVVHVSKSKSK